MVFQDHLKSLKRKTSDGVAETLYDIVYILGALYILQADNGRESAHEVVKSLCAKWDGVKLVDGWPRHSES